MRLIGAFTPFQKRHKYSNKLKQQRETATRGGDGGGRSTFSQITCRRVDVLFPFDGPVIPALFHADRSAALSASRRGKLRARMRARGRTCIMNRSPGAFRLRPRARRGQKGRTKYKSHSCHVIPVNSRDQPRPRDESDDKT